MMKTQGLTTLVVTFIAVVGLAGNADAAILYGNFIGDQVDFLDVSEDSPTDALPLLGAPTLVGDGLVFNTGTFVAQASGGGTDTTTSILSLTLRAHPGKEIDTVSLRAMGDYTLAGFSAGGGATRFGVSNTLSVLDVVPGTHGVSAIAKADTFEMSAGPGSKIESFEQLLEISLAGLGIAEVTLNLESVITVTSEAQTSALGAAKVLDGPRVTVSGSAPEPSAGLLFAVGGGVMGLCGRRVRR